MIVEGRAPDGAVGSSRRQSRSIAGVLGLVVLAILGHACALALIDVRPYAMFQHYQPWRWIAAERPLAAWGVLVQGIIVGMVTWKLRARLRQVALLLLRRAWFVVAVLAGFSLAVPTESVPRFAGEVLLAGALALIALLNLVLAVVILPDSAIARAEAWVDARVTLRPGPNDVKAWDRYLPGAVSIWVAVLAAATSYIVLERLPHIDDGVSYYFQARYFAVGRLYLPAPPDAQSFQVDQTVIDIDRWFAYGFPAWPAVLAIGVRVGMPWLVNPLLGGVLILVGHALILRRSDRGTANGAVLLLAVSPWLIFMSAEFMPHPLAALLVLLAALAFDHASGSGQRWLPWAFLAGVAAGALMLTRAFDGVIALAALGVTSLIDRRLPRRLLAVVLTGLVAATVAALSLAYNKAVTGRATYPPHLAWSDSHWGPGVDRVGFGAGVGIRAWPNLDPLPGHGPADVVLNANKNAFMTNVDLFGWAFGSLLFVWIGLALARWRREDTLLLTMVAAFIAGYSAYWFSGGPDLGARYWYPLLVPLAALTVRGAQMATARLAASGMAHAGARIGVLMAVASVSAALVMVPWRATTKHYRYRGIGGEIRELAAQHRFGHALVFVRAEEKQKDYAAAFTLNPPTLEDPGTIYAFDAGRSNRARVVAHFSDRPVWVIGRDSSAMGDAPLRVIAGPLAPSTVPE